MGKIVLKLGRQRGGPKHSKQSKRPILLGYGQNRGESRKARRDGLMKNVWAERLAARQAAREPETPAAVVAYPVLSAGDAVMTPLGQRQVVSVETGNLAYPAGLAICRDGDGTAHWNVHTLRTLNGEPYADPLPLERIVWTQDPRADPRLGSELKAESAQWTRLLGLTWDEDGGRPGAIFQALQGIRCAGACLERTNDGRLRIAAGEMTTEEYTAERDARLVPHRPVITKLLKRLEGEIAQGIPKGAAYIDSHLLLEVPRYVEVRGHGRCRLVAVEGDIVSYRTAEGAYGACIGWCANENGQPMRERPAPDRSYWTADPRPDLVEDSDLWRVILAGLYDLTGLDAEDGQGEPVISGFIAWHCARILGARLTVTDSKGHLDVSAEDAGDQAEIDGLLRPHHRRLQTVLPGIVIGAQKI